MWNVILDFDGRIWCTDVDGKRIRESLRANLAGGSFAMMRSARLCLVWIFKFCIINQHGMMMVTFS